MDTMPVNMMIAMLVVITVWVLVFLLFRKTVCWYFKIDKVVDSLDAIKEKAGIWVPEEIKSQDAAMIDETQFYAQAMAECRETISERNKGLWAKAFSMTGGDERRAEARYIGLRVPHLIKAHRNEVVPFKCPKCGVVRSKMTRGMIADEQASPKPDWKRQCTDCRVVFDLMDVLPELKVTK
ncbi:MAG: hypothetical protein WCN95_07180 [bacterium]